MAHNILLTSLSAMENDLPLRFFSAKNESGPEYTDTILDAEAGIKTVLSRYDIDKIVVIGAVGSYGEDEDLEPVSLRQGRKLNTTDKASASTYGLLLDRLTKFAEGEKEEESIPEEVRDKLINFIRDFTEQNPDLKNKEFNRLFDELAQNDQLYENFRTMLFEACPEFGDNPGYYKQCVKEYLYSALEPSLKMKMLPANEATSVCFIPDVEFEDSGRWVDNMMNAEKSITEDEEEVNLYVTLNSDDAADTFIVLNMLDILLSMPESKVQLKKIFTVRSLQKCMAGIIRDDTEGFGVTELFHAIRAFLKYGKADMIEDIWKRSGESNESVADMIYAMRDVDVGLSMCNTAEVERGILRLRELFRSEKFWRESGYYGVLFSLIAESIREDYGVLLEGDGNINFIEMVKWAYRHQFYQQTLTLIESRTPENLVNSGIFYYCNDEDHKDYVLRQFAELRMKLRPQEYFKMDYIDHYFIKSYDRGKRRERDENPQRAYAALRIKSIGNRNPSVITGFTACESRETLLDALYAYYQVGYVRNQISHAETSTIEKKNAEASGSDDISALSWMKESIEFFIESFEKAKEEVQGKNPKIIIITADEVRKLSESMRNNREGGEFKASKSKDLSR